MGMNLGSDSTTEDEGIVDINTTPLIDVMLVLLIMLIITIPLQTQAVSIDLPQGNPPPPTHEVPVATIAVDFDNSITWNGAPITSEDDLQAHLREVAAVPEDDQAETHLQANRLADYKTVIHIMADAQRLGVRKIGIVGLEQFTEGQ
ncbi:MULTISPECIES: ExbD/TolR family protein [Acetobacter]|uniref:Biopolymer transporter ExbD n=1 Tax=Acetobacter thailandicus TaxID=1502842 RepID=A0ABT3QDU5_9PROT|nr:MULTISPECIES: biopolymer transporter ExbD [Acetobacter]MBS0960143.1 biopolymer transporter ExbD [Acetobacter thailandicus]MBS0979828.1 biopolymer transporter ExbD [Acetobacter thailandicus]MBS0985368.1 biopolymer transporter ExbD [Acetobacter thailandicus]MBS1004262.1 biopolymer transporter ExbD [Acetobacter thailandicus]MCX2563467.1 biopolymer transporter ExbD [Acetobacter thailandicus]